MSLETDITLDLFNEIYQKVKDTFSSEMNEQIRTKSGNTQNAERIYITFIRGILTEMDLTFSEAASQQPYDFRITIPGSDEILKLEAKKTDNFNIFFNDTCPYKDSYYLIFYTGKKYKKKTDIPSKIIGVNGYEFIKQCPWIEQFREKLEILKKEFKDLEGPMSVYPRPTYKSCIKFLL